MPNGVGGEDEARILVPVIGELGVGAVGAPIGDRVERLQGRRDLASGRKLDGEMTVGHVEDRCGQRLGAAVDEVERGREARRQPPLHVGRRIGERRGGDSRPRRGSAQAYDELPTSRRHPCSPVVVPSAARARRFDC